MGPSSPQNDAEPDERISALVSEFFDRQRRGEDLTPERFAAEHPEVARELRPYLAALPLIHSALPGIGKVRGSPQDVVAGETPPGATEFPAIAGYKLIEKVGRGGMGAVYKALQVSTKRIVALKVMLGGPFASSSARRRFEREVELAARLTHPRIVRVLESGEVAGQPYYAMDYVAGVRLDRYLSAARPDLRMTLRLFVQICAAVEYAHAHGVIHRDLKPANVLVDDDGQPHILDFGLAKATDQADSEEALTAYVSLPGQVLGTLFYLSPEQAAGAPENIDVRTDVYALGVMLFEALTGSLPFATKGPPSQIIQRILEAPPTRPSALSNQVDGELEAILLKSLEKDRARRFQSAADLGDDIGRYLAGEPIRARRPSGFYVLRKKLRKHRVGVTLGAISLVLVLLGLVVGVWWQERALAQARRAILQEQRRLESGNASVVLGPARALCAQHPQLPEARLLWAQALYANQQRDTAIRFLERDLEGAPSRWFCRALLAEVYRATGNPERAAVLQAQVERDMPDTAEAWYIRSFATLDPQRALYCAQQCVQRSSSHHLAWERLTRLRLQAGDLDGALQGAEQLIQLGQDEAAWGLVKGQILSRQGHFRRAVEQYTEVIRIRGESAAARVHRASAYRHLGEYERAVTDYNKSFEARAKATPNVWHLYQRATPLWILGRTDEALADYERVRTLLGKPSYADARRFLILREQGRQREAREVLQAALRDVDVEDEWLRQIFRCLAGQITPNELVALGAARNQAERLCEAYYYAGEVCLLSNQPAEAREWFELCVQTGVQFDPDAALGTPMNEFELARWRLDTLLADERPTSRP